MNTRHRAARVLLIEDDTVDRLAVRRALAKADFHPRLTEASDYASARAALLSGEFDCVLSDVYLPGGDGLELLREARAAGLQIPVIMLTGQGDEALAVELMKAGATDYLPKALLSPDVLVQSVRRAFRIYDAEEATRHAQKELERLYAEAQRATAARDQVLAVVSHDLRNPLAVVRLNASILREDLAAGQHDVKASLQHLDRIERATASIDRLIADLLDAVYIDANTFSIHAEAVQANALLAESAERGRGLAEQKGCSISVSKTDDAMRVRADRERVLQVFGNLIGNALKFVPAEGGRISLGAERVDGMIHFSVTDNGPGIPAEHIDRLFERFWRGRSTEHGAGLGLFIARGIVEAHGGTIDVDTNFAPGAKIRFHLPVADA